MATELLVEQRDDGRRLLERLAREEFEVAAAFWVRTSDDGLWQLYIASPLVVEERLLEVYRKLYAALEDSPSAGVTPSDLKPLNDQNPIARAAIRERDDHPGKKAFMYRGGRLGDLTISAAYIYPEIGPLRLSFTVTYFRRGNTNTWTAEVKRGELFRGTKVKGAFSYTTAGRPADTEADQRFAIVGVLVAIDPKFDHPEILNDPGMRRLTAEQARIMADEMFKSYHPDAIIEEERVISTLSMPPSMRETLIEHDEDEAESVVTEKGPVLGQ